MYRLWIRWRAKRATVYKQELEAAVAELSAKASLCRAEETRRAAAKIRKEADGIAARIAQMQEMEEKGYWECEEGHETPMEQNGGGVNVVCQHCPTCAKEVKLISRATMSPKEQYDSDKERKDAEKVAEQKRLSAAEMDKDIENQEGTARNYINLAQRGRAHADMLRKL